MGKHPGTVAVASMVTLVGLTATSCGSDDDDDSSRTGGAPGDSTGGTEAVGGSSAGGAAAGGSASTGGRATTGGTVGLGGGGSTDVEGLARLACSNWQANGFVLGCSAAFSSDYVANCTQELVQAADTCSAEVIALLECGTLLTALDYACDDANEVTFAAGVCETESSALEQCHS
jgi:hypothetical protein